MKLFSALINSNIYVSLAAVLLTVESQIQLGMEPQWHPYLFIIFFATLFEYNIHRFITVIRTPEALNTEKHRWVRENLRAFYWLVFLSVAGFTCVVFMAKKEVLVALAPIAAITLFYSMPVGADKSRLFRLREIPYLKIFLIAAVWASITILLPVIQSGKSFDRMHLLLMLAERFFFAMGITIPFDIRDLDTDRKTGLKTIPYLLSEKNSYHLANACIIIFLLLCLVHYRQPGQMHILIALVISGISTIVFLTSTAIRKTPLYHYGILDGTLLLQGLLVIIFHSGIS